MDGGEKKWQEENALREIPTSIISSKEEEFCIQELPVTQRDESMNIGVLENGSRICSFIHILLREKPLVNVKRNVRNNKRV